MKIFECKKCRKKVVEGEKRVHLLTNHGEGWTKSPDLSEYFEPNPQDGKATEKV